MDTLTVTVDGQKREILMSYGLLNELSRHIQDPAQIPAIAVNADMRDTVLKAVLAGRKKSGKITTPVDDLDEIEISLEDIERILGWVGEHLMGFFVRSLAKTVEATEKHEEQLKKLVSSFNTSTA